MATEPTLNLEDEADLMDAYLAGLLDEPDRERFEQKMTRDLSLRKRVDEARVTANLVSDAYRYVTPGPSFESALTTRITQMIPDMDDVPLVDNSEPQVSARMKFILGLVIAVVAAIGIAAALLIFI